jgi:hypothetical protein
MDSMGVWDERKGYEFQLNFLNPQALDSNFSSTFNFWIIEKTRKSFFFLLSNNSKSISGWSHRYHGIGTDEGQSEGKHG